MSLLPEEVAIQNASREKEARVVAYFVAKIKQTFGPPPIVTGENPQDFDRILAELVRARHPTDVFIQMDVWDIAVSIWFDKRLNRASKLVLDRKIRENLDFQNQRPQQKLIPADNHAQRDDGNADDRGTEAKRKDELQTVSEETPRQVEIPLDEGATEEANARAFEQAMPLLTDIDDLKTRSFFRRNVSRQMWRERRPAFIPPLSVIQQKLEFEMRAEDQRAWNAEFVAELAAQKKARTANPAEQSDIPTVPSPGVGNP